jgi:hypothetical protein
LPDHAGDPAAMITEMARRAASIDRPRLWPRLAGGCLCGRDTVAVIETAGLRIDEIRSFDLGPACLRTNPYVLGRARAA